VHQIHHHLKRIPVFTLPYQFISKANEFKRDITVEFTNCFFDKIRCFRCSFLSILPSGFHGKEEKLAAGSKNEKEKKRNFLMANRIEEE